MVRPTPPTRSTPASSASAGRRQSAASRPADSPGGPLGGHALLGIGAGVAVLVTTGMKLAEWG
ncbi:hypothetical protein [Halorussus lipolyticus]|uniref:hypothetical protein n=1 Tax=Halorussus lipolyticus TaxID=3034024 RepID=UPI0023E8F93F|nr:hypothetical protein [Halorussus sp. DT80]